MRYANHNFFSNFMNENSDGYNISRDMVISETAKAIEGKSVEVKDAIFECGVDIDPNASKSKVAEVLSGHLGKNDCLQAKLANIIIDNNLTKKNIEYFNSVGDFFKSEGFAQLLGTAIGVTFGAVKQRQATKQAEAQREYEQELARINAEALKNQMRLEELQQSKSAGAQGGGSNVGKIVLWSVVGVGVIVGGYFLIKKLKK